MFFKRSRFIWHTGEQPPRGGYICAICCSDYSMVDIRREGQALPRCPVCDGDEWMRI